MINDLATVKQHLRVSSSVEDPLIQLYIDAAEDWIINYVDGSIPRVPPEPADWDETALDDNGIARGPYPIELVGTVFPSVVAAQLLLVADLYENREAQHVGISVVDNPAVTRLLHPYRRRMGV